METLFRLENFDETAKRLLIVTPHSELRLSVDWDDVYQIDAALQLRKALRILNEHWQDAEYIQPDAEDLPNLEADDPKYWRAEIGQGREITKIMNELTGQSAH